MPGLFGGSAEDRIAELREENARLRSEFEGQLENARCEWDGACLYPAYPDYEG